MAAHQATTREALAMTEATAMIGTASRGPNTSTSAGISMMEVPKPTTPPKVPATRPRTKTRAKSTGRLSPCMLEATPAVLDMQAADCIVVSLRLGRKAMVASRFVYVTYIRTTPEKLWRALKE